MKLKTVYGIALLFILALFGCKNKKTESTIVLEGLALNNGKQWVANQETHIGMKRIDSILKTETSIDTKTLGNILSKETSYIIKSCNIFKKCQKLPRAKFYGLAQYGRIYDMVSWIYSEPGF